MTSKQQKTIRTLNASKTILEFRENTIARTKQALADFDSRHASMNENDEQARARASVLAYYGGNKNDWDIIDEDWRKWTERQTLIDNATQKIRVYCMKAGNTKEQCICAFESEGLCEYVMRKKGNTST